MTSDGHINAYGVSVRWQSTDNITPSATAEPTESAIPTESSSSSPGLSGGAKAGIGIGVAVGVLSIIALLVLYFLRRRRTPSPQSQDQKYEFPPTTRTGVFAMETAELSTERTPTTLNKAELPGESTAMSTTNQVELPGHDVPELDGRRR